MTQSEIIEGLIEVFGSEQRLADAIPPASRRVVLRWANEQHVVPPGAWASMQQALRKRLEQMRGLERALGERTVAADYARDRL